MAWEDTNDDMTPEIDDDFGSDGFHERYARALDLVGNRHSKAELASLVAYLLKREGQSDAN